jgi:signal transduction histidine kinase
LDKGDGNIWMCVWDQENGGLDLYNIATKKFKHYLHGLIVWQVFKSSEGKTWACTSKGLFYRNDSLDTFIQIGDKNFEFTKAKIKSVTEDADKNLWGVSSQGIFRYDPHKDQLYMYGDKFGTFDVGTFGFEPSFTTSWGELLFGNPNGYYKCLPNRMYNSASPRIVITDFEINGHSIKSGNEVLLKGALEDAEKITLNHSQNRISIDFAAIHFADPENNIHQYMLEGYENEWRDVRVEKAAYYFNVPTGHYVFKVRATSSYGVNAEKSIRIVVLPPWWQTWWAYTLYAILLASAVWTFIKWRTKALKKEKDVLEIKVNDRTKELKKEKELVEKTLSELKTTQAQLIQAEKMASLGEMTAGIAHEIQNPLNFVNNFSEVNTELIDELTREAGDGNIEEVKAIAKDIRDNELKIVQHGKRADAIVKGMLQHSRTSSGLKEPTDINALCDEYLRLAYHGLRAKDKDFNTEIKTEFDNSIGKINVIPQDIGRVILNLINNAFYAVDEKKKQLGDGYEPAVSVSTRLIIPPSGGQRGAEIKISDNGNGIPKKLLDKIFQPFFTTKPTGQGTGLGLSLSYDIIKVHGGEIKVHSNEAEGTEFIVQLPSV